MSNVPQTPNFKLFKPPFDRKAWHQYMNKNMATIDAVLTTYLDVGNIVGVWDNSTSYSEGDRVIDEVVGQVFEAAVDHISAASPSTFSEDRIANPTYWTSLAVTARGLDAWTPGTLYQPNDFVVSGAIYAVCLSTHTSGATFAGDSQYWDYLIDISAAPILPSFVGNALKILRVRADELGAEWIDNASLSSYLGLGTAAFVAAASFASAAHNHILAEISDMSANARTFNAAANYAAMRAALQVPNIAGDTFTGQVVIDVGATLTAALRLVSSEASASAAPTLLLDRASASPADGDLLGVITFQGRDTVAAITPYAQMDAVAVDVDDGTEDGRIRFLTLSGGAQANRLNIEQGVYWPSVTGGDKGPGMLNWAGYYYNNEPQGSTVAVAAVPSAGVTLTSATNVQITFATENFDIGGFFAASAWTPPAGKYRVDVAVELTSANAVDNEIITLIIRRSSGGDTSYTFKRSGTGTNQSITASCILDMNGSENVTVLVNKGGAGNGATTGNAATNYFHGSAL